MGRDILNIFMQISMMFDLKQQQQNRKRKSAHGGNRRQHSKTVNK